MTRDQKNIIDYIYKLDNIEKQTVELMYKYEELYCLFFNKKQVFVFSRNEDPRKNKYFNKFKNLLKYSKQKNSPVPDLELFIKAQFEYIKNTHHKQDLNCSPGFIFTNSATKRYKNYIEQVYLQTFIKENKKENLSKNKNYIINELKNTYNFLKNYSINQYGEKNINYNKILNNNDILLFIRNNQISPYFLCLSNSYKEKENKIDDNLDIYRKEISKDKQIIEIAKSIFKGEINEF